MRALCLLMLCLAVGVTLRAADMNSEVFSNMLGPEPFRDGLGIPTELKALTLGPGPLYDISDSLTRNLLPVSPGGLALYAPSTRRVYVKDTLDQLAAYASLFGGCATPVTVRTRLEVVRLGQPAEPPLASVECVSNTGVKQTIKWGASSENSLDFEPVVGPDGELIDCHLTLRFQYASQAYELATELYVISGQSSSLLELTEQRPDGAHEVLAARFCATIQVVDGDKTELRRRRMELARKVEEELSAVKEASE